MVLSTDKRLSLSRKVLFSVAILQFLLTTVHMALQLYGVYVQGGSIHAVKARDVLAMVTVRITYLRILVEVLLTRSTSGIFGKFDLDLAGLDGMG